MHIKVTENKDFYLDGHGYGYPSYTFELEQYKISSIPILKGKKVFYMALLIKPDFSIEETRTVELTTVCDHTASLAAFDILSSRLAMSLDAYMAEFIRKT